MERELERQIPALFAAASTSGYGFGEMLSTALLAVQGAVTLTGATRARHPSWYRKPIDLAAPGNLVCHRHACSLPLATVQEAETEALRRIQRPS
jgi:hypothetical protein